MRKTIQKLIICLIVAAWAQVAIAEMPAPGKAAPVFSLMDANGAVCDLSTMQDQKMIVLYFFDAASSSSLEGLLALDSLAKKYKDADLKVWGITFSPKASVDAFVGKSKPVFPVLIDTSSKVSGMYDAKMILPTVCIIGPDLKIIDLFQGGGKSTEVMLARLAERKLAQQDTRIASAISKTVEKINPENYETIAISGYAELDQGNTDKATKIFTDLSKKGGKAKAIGLEGLAKISFDNGDFQKALSLADQVLEISPDRSYANVLKGTILYGQNKKEEAKKELETAVAKKEGSSHQKALAYNQLGRVYANDAEYKKARKFYDHATDLDPYYVEATSNKGITYEKEGKWDTALEMYKKAQALNTSDLFAKVLAKKAEEMMALQKDIENRKRVDRLVKDLSERYRSQKKIKAEITDDWTSRPLVLTFVDIEEKGSLAEADGYGMVVLNQLSDLLNASGRVKVVERIVMDRLLDELNLGSSELASKDTALRLGNILAAKLVSTGSLLLMPKGALLNMRFIDTETTLVSKVITEEVGKKHPLEKDLNHLNRDILKSVIENYPIKGFIVQPESDQVMINIGENQGVVLGTVFNVVEEKAPVEYKGRLLKSAPKVIGEIKVTQVEPDLSYAAIVNKNRDLMRDDKIKEKLVVR